MASGYQRQPRGKEKKERMWIQASSGAEGSTGRDDPSSSLRDGRGHVRKHAQVRGPLQSIERLPIDRAILQRRRIRASYIQGRLLRRRLVR